MNLWIRHDGTELTTDTDGFTVDTATEPDEPEPGEPEGDAPDTRAAQ